MTHIKKKTHNLYMYEWRFIQSFSTPPLCSDRREENKTYAGFMTIDIRIRKTISII
jgi:hypothetical protein